MSTEVQDSKNIVHLKVNDSYTSQDVKQIQDYLSKIPTDTKISVVLNKDIQQINDNQKIVDELIKCYRECRSRQENLAISEFETNQQLFMERLCKRAVGKNIENL